VDSTITFGDAGGWVDRESGHGPAYQFRGPDGHLFELFYETTLYVPSASQRPYLKNQPPNERLIEMDPAQLYNVGRAAIRTTLARLEQDGLVEREPNRGARVRAISEEEAVETLEARAVLEGLAARYAARNVTDADIADLRCAGLLARWKRAWPRATCWGSPRGTPASTTGCCRLRTTRLWRA